MRRGDPALLTEDREVHGDNWIAIVVVGIVVGICIVILLFVLCCLSHQSRKAASLAQDTSANAGEPEADIESDGGTEGVQTRVALKPIASSLLSDHLAGASTGMIFGVVDKFAPNGKRFKKA